MKRRHTTQLDLPLQISNPEMSAVQKGAAATARAPNNIVALRFGSALPKHDKSALEQVLAFANNIGRQIK